MTHEDFQEILEDQLTRLKGVLSAKEKEYSSSDDQLHNFIVAAELQGITPKEALAGMMAKHTVSIFDMVRSDNDYTFVKWDEKITDHIIYCILLRACVLEELQNKSKG